MFMNDNLTLIIIFTVIVSLIISMIPNLTNIVIGLFNLNIVRGLFIIYIGYLSIYNVDLALVFTLLFLIMLEISNRIERFESGDEEDDDDAESDDDDNEEDEEDDDDDDDEDDEDVENDEDE